MATDLQVITPAGTSSDNQADYTSHVHNIISEKIAKLEDTLQSNSTVGFDMATELSYIHRTLKENRQVTFLLTDEQIGSIVKGFSKEANIVISAAAPKKVKSKTPLSIEDF